MAYAGYLLVVFLLVGAAAGSAVVGTSGFVPWLYVPYAYRKARYDRAGRQVLSDYNHLDSRATPWLQYCGTMAAARTPLWYWRKKLKLIIMARELGSEASPMAYEFIANVIADGYAVEEITELPRYVPPREAKIHCV